MRKRNRSDKNDTAAENTVKSPFDKNEWVQASDASFLITAPFTNDEIGSSLWLVFGCFLFVWQIVPFVFPDRLFVLFFEARSFFVFCRVGKV